MMDYAVIMNIMATVTGEINKMVSTKSKGGEDVTLVEILESLKTIIDMAITMLKDSGNDPIIIRAE